MFVHPQAPTGTPLWFVILLACQPISLWFKGVLLSGETDISLYLISGLICCSPSRRTLTRKYTAVFTVPGF